MKNKKDDIFLIGPEDYFDDCPICQEMKKAEKEGRGLTENEIKLAFEESKKVGGLVGFPPDEKDKKAN